MGQDLRGHLHLHRTFFGPPKILGFTMNVPRTSSFQYSLESKTTEENFNWLRLQQKWPSQSWNPTFFANRILCNCYGRTSQTMLVSAVDGSPDFLFLYCLIIFIFFLILFRFSIALIFLLLLFLLCSDFVYTLYSLLCPRWIPRTILIIPSPPPIKL